MLNKMEKISSNLELRKSEVKTKEIWIHLSLLLQLTNFKKFKNLKKRSKLNNLHNFGNKTLNLIQESRKEVTLEYLHRKNLRTILLDVQTAKLKLHLK